MRRFCLIRYRPRCDRCGGRSIPIVYGYPSPDVLLRARVGDVAIGGCVVQSRGPTLACADCGALW
jgi:hypothetical protein